MTATFPFMTAFDPVGTSEGSLDPMGLYQIADQLAVQLVPAVRERMHRIRFLTAMAVSAMVTEGLEDDPRRRDSSPYLVWEWLVVEALVRTVTDDSSILNVPGTSVVGRALDRHDCVDAHSYLKTPRVFGFHGVYKRLAIHLGIVDVHLERGPNAEALVDAWARDLCLSGLESARPLLSGWTEAVKRSLREETPRTNPRWNKDQWSQLANAFAPSALAAREKHYLRDLLHSTDDRRLGALPVIWQLQDEFSDDGYQEEALHHRLEEEQPTYGPLIGAIRAYEAFARSLQGAFDVLRAEAGALDIQGFNVADIAHDDDFRLSVQGLEKRFETAHRALGELSVPGMSLQNLFTQRFSAFADAMAAVDCARAICSHHESVQRMKSAEGKLPWFQSLAPGRIYIRQAYRVPRREVEPGHYVHTYRGQPIREFYTDLK